MQQKARKLAEAVLTAHKNIAAGSGMIINGEVDCHCTDCELAREVLEE